MCIIISVLLCNACYFYIRMMYTLTLYTCDMYVISIMFCYLCYVYYLSIIMFIISILLYLLSLLLCLLLSLYYYVMSVISYDSTRRLDTITLYIKVCKMMTQTIKLTYVSLRMRKNFVLFR